MPQTIEVELDPITSEKYKRLIEKHGGELIKFLTSEVDNALGKFENKKYIEAIEGHVYDKLKKEDISIEERKGEYVFIDVTPVFDGETGDVVDVNAKFIGFGKKPYISTKKFGLFGKNNKNIWAFEIEENRVKKTSTYIS